jgi:hypothetical protein
VSGAAPKEEQLALSERLQTKLLRDFERILDDQTATAADRAVIFKFLHANGWNVDPAAIPQSVRGVLAANLDPNALDDDDVIPMFRKATG